MYSYDDEDNVAMNEDAMPHRENCRDWCRLAQYCYKPPQTRKDFPEECSQYYHIEDILADAEDIREEQWKARGFDDDENPYPPEEFDDGEDEEPIPFDEPPEAWEVEDDG